MQFDNSFSVQARIDEVFEAVSNIAHVVSCVPGAKVLDHRRDDVYEVALRTRLGPAWRSYAGTITVHKRDDSSHRVAMTNRARDSRGRVIGEALIEIGLAELGSHTNVSITSRVTIVDGMLAERTIHKAAAEQMAQFTANLRALVDAG